MHPGYGRNPINGSWVVDGCEALEIPTSFYIDQATQNFELSVMPTGGTGGNQQPNGQPPNGQQPPDNNQPPPNGQQPNGQGRREMQSYTASWCAQALKIEAQAKASSASPAGSGGGQAQASNGNPGPNKAPAPNNAPAPDSNAPGGNICVGDPSLNCAQHQGDDAACNTAAGCSVQAPPPRQPLVLATRIFAAGSGQPIKPSVKVMVAASTLGAERADDAVGCGAAAGGGCW